MKQLLVISFFFALFIFFAGCQSESPVAPEQTSEVTSLERPGPFAVNVEVNVSDDEVTFSWARVGGAKSYYIEYFWQNENNDWHMIATTTTSDLTWTATYAAESPYADTHDREVVVYARNKKGNNIKYGTEYGF